MANFLPYCMVAIECNEFPNWAEGGGHLLKYGKVSDDVLMINCRRTDFQKIKKKKLHDFHFRSVTVN